MTEGTEEMTQKDDTPRDAAHRVAALIGAYAVALASRLQTGAPHPTRMEEKVFADLTDSLRSLVEHAHDAGYRLAVRQREART